ncbi:cathelicidin antimicrobial peptide-like [Tachyglossus aculeatus]|uniref:cathelicidin antimicrobial peptide-like n=1 Tax=Tachyglossus aculeatus TaxID=9261 RepID=UPI0018F486F4|nr:cathelicidin antimicrobial peptide-like [Tachyglossus aculeatus]
MEAAWKALLLAAVATLATAQSLSFEEALAGTIATYNKESNSDNLFRLHRLQLQEGTSNSANIFPVNFTIHETVCSKKEETRPLDQCDFKEGGLVRECSGTISMDKDDPSVNVTCNGPVRTKRRFGRFFKKVKNALKKGIKKIGRGIQKLSEKIGGLNLKFQVPLPQG